MKHDPFSLSNDNDEFSQAVYDELKLSLKHPSSLLYIAFILIACLFLMAQGFRVLINKDVLLGAGFIATAFALMVYIYWEHRKEKLSDAILKVKIRKRLAEHAKSNAEQSNDDHDNIFNATKKAALNKINNQYAVFVLLTLVVVPVLFLIFSWKVAIPSACVIYILFRIKAKLLVVRALVNDVDDIIEDEIQHARISTVPGN